LAIKNDYAACYQLAKSHYENFPVASFILPKSLRDAVVAIYAFARMADDIADDCQQPLDTPQARQAKLNTYADKIHLIAEHSQDLNPDSAEARDWAMSRLGNDPYFLALFDTIVRHQLNPQYFLDLLTAFSFDTTLTTLQDEAQLLWYCRHSANPVGRLLLQLFKVENEAALQASDALCTALQLLNFLQDWHEDLIQRNRCYFPMTELNAAGLSLSDLQSLQHPEKIRIFLNQNLHRPETLLKNSKALLNHLPLRYRIHIFLVILGAHGIMRALKARKQPNTRPKLSCLTLLKSFMP